MKSKDRVESVLKMIDPLPHLTHAEAMSEIRNIRDKMHDMVDEIEESTGGADHLVMPSETFQELAALIDQITIVCHQNHPQSALGKS